MITQQVMDFFSPYSILCMITVELPLMAGRITMVLSFLRLETARRWDVKSAISHSSFFYLIQGYLKTGVTSHLSLSLHFVERRSTARYFCYRDSE